LQQNTLQERETHPQKADRRLAVELVDTLLDARDNVAGEPDRVQRYARLAELFKLLAHPERLRILDVLRRAPECVCHLEALLQKSQPYVSQQLRLLRQAGAIVDEKRGNNVYYRLVDEQLAEWLDVVLGPAVEPDPDLSFYKAAIPCACPKCEGAAEATG
jgi:DNA-binding transcriptional ArsR family regulator